MKRILIIAALLALTAGGSTNLFVNPHESTALDYDQYITTDSLLMLVSNVASIGTDLGDVFHGIGGCFYPFATYDSIAAGGPVRSPLWASGLWFGGLVNDSLRVSIAEFSSEFWPGPMQGGTFIPDADTVGAYRVYRLFADSLESNPNQDYTEWPSGDGAPLDSQGRPFSMGAQTLWAVCNDANPAVHTNQATSTDPLGIEVHQTVWTTGDVGDDATVYIKYKMYNKGGNDIDSFYLGFWMDADLGWAEDDAFGCDTLDDVFYCYNGDNDDAVGGDTTWSYGSIPPAIGYKIIHGPVVASSNDTAFFDGYPMPGYRNMHMTGYQIYGAGGDPRDPDSALEAYHLLQGLQMDGSVAANGTRFRWPGDPVTGAGDVDTIPGEKKVLASFGPLDFTPGDSQQIVIKMAIARGTDRLNSLEELRTKLNAESQIPTAVDDNTLANLPNAFRLRQNYPNPFNPETVIEYTIPEPAHVRLDVFNILGRQVDVLVNREQTAGDHEAVWDGTDGAGERVASGVYLCRLTAGNHTTARKMMLVK